MLKPEAFVWFTEGTGFLVTLYIKIFLISKKLIRGNKVTKDIKFGFYQVFKNNTELASIFHKGNERVFGPAELLFWDKIRTIPSLFAQMQPQHKILRKTFYWRYSNTLLEMGP